MRPMKVPMIPIPVSIPGRCRKNSVLRGVSISTRSVKKVSAMTVARQQSICSCPMASMRFWLCRVSAYSFQRCCRLPVDIASVSMLSKSTMLPLPAADWIFFNSSITRFNLLIVRSAGTKNQTTKATHENRSKETTIRLGQDCRIE